MTGHTEVIAPWVQFPVCRRFAQNPVFRFLSLTFGHSVGFPPNGCRPFRPVFAVADWSCRVDSKGGNLLPKENFLSPTVIFQEPRANNRLSIENKRR